MENGRVQCVLVLLFSILFNISRWFELEYEYGVSEVNITAEDGVMRRINQTRVVLKVGKPLSRTNTL